MPAARSAGPREAPQALAIEGEAEARRWVGSTTSNRREEQGRWIHRGLRVAARAKEGKAWSISGAGGE